MNAISVHEELKEKNGDLELLTKIIKTVHKSSSLEEIYCVTLDSVMELENIDAGSAGKNLGHHSILGIPLLPRGKGYRCYLVRKL